MKKIFIFIFALSAAFFACSDDNSDEIDDLKKQLEAEKEKTATGVTFEGNNMVVAFSNGTKSTVAIPEGLQGAKGEQGEQGPKGDTGDGIESVTYDEATGILTITLTNGSKTSFGIAETANGLVAVLLDDSKGAGYIKTLYMGAVPLVENEYDDNFNLTKSTVSVAIDGQILKSNLIEKTYSGSRLTGIKTTEYATSKEIRYKYEEIDNRKDFYYYFDAKLSNNDYHFTMEQDSLIMYHYLGSQYIYDEELRQEIIRYEYHKYYLFQDRLYDGNTDYSMFEINNGNGIYTLFVAESAIYYNEKTYYTFRKYNNVIKSTDPISFYRPSNDVVYRVNQIYVYNLTDEYYQMNAKYTDRQEINIGDVLSVSEYTFESNDKDQIVKAYDGDSRYTRIEYNNDGTIAKVEEFKKNGNDWIQSDRYSTYQYTDGLLVSVKTFDSATPAGKNVMETKYDNVGNPIEISAYRDASYTYGWNAWDPWSSDHSYSDVEQRPAGMYLVGKIEYNYNYKNFLGNTAGAIWPTLSNYKLKNAIKRITAVEAMSLGSIEYKDFNEYGYPETISGNGSFDGGSMYLEFMLDYVVKATE